MNTKKKNEGVTDSIGPRGAFRHCAKLPEGILFIKYWIDAVSGKNDKIIVKLTTYQTTVLGNLQTNCKTNHLETTIRGKLRN